MEMFELVNYASDTTLDIIRNITSLLLDVIKTRRKCCYGFKLFNSLLKLIIKNKTRKRDYILIPGLTIDEMLKFDTNIVKDNLIMVTKL